MYIIITSKPGEFEAQPGDGLEKIESWRYRFGSQTRAIYSICRVLDDKARVLIVDAEDARGVNRVPCKFFGDFADIESARADIRALTSFANLDAGIERID